ncbi:hypothetical protein MUCCIDRAFT_154866 [Mucor lusitanicus CBS 277.49]|uniref:Uncharacterized protein n=1 Tax=Mucor lusitanicus CBS 277.49 TaxID=747725 RepID=A0A168PUB2_MUCCL|nr:hypothetical protein MUCCIDRAFT_154866 [Mucor lusitanicus CBS 277.49]
MKFSAIALVGSLIAGASALQNFQTADKQLNISSPLLNGVYIAGQILPLSYTPLSPNIVLNIYLKGANINESAVALNADTSNDPTSNVPIKVDNMTYYQHSINYAIPTTYPAGNYECIYENVATHTNTSIPISVLAYVPPPGASSANSTAVSAAPTASETSIILAQPSSA